MGGYLGEGVHGGLDNYLFKYFHSTSDDHHHTKILACFYLQTDVPDTNNAYAYRGSFFPQLLEHCCSAPCIYSACHCIKGGGGGCNIDLDGLRRNLAGFDLKGMRGNLENLGMYVDKI